MADFPLFPGDPSERWQGLRGAISDYGSIVGFTLLAFNFIIWVAGVIPYFVALPLGGAFAMLGLLGIWWHVSSERPMTCLGKLWDESKNTAPPRIGSALPEVPEEKATRTKDKQGIACWKEYVTPIVFKNGTVPTLQDTEDADTFDAAIAELVNNPNAQDWVPTITYLEAQITYYDVDGKFCHRVTRCFWMDEVESYIQEFGPDVKGKLLIAVNVDGRTFVAENIQSGESKDLYELTADSYRVQVQLSQGGTFAFDLTCQPRLNLETAGLNTPFPKNASMSNGKTRNLEIARKLKEYQDVGENILRRCAREALAPVAQIIYWQDEVEAYIKGNVGEFQAIEFSKSAPITVYPNQACNRDLTNKVYTQIERIGQIISELRPS